ncbi:hypothetical protein [Streptomyces sp. NPDC007991]|uniref:hypothetical protein n=1 Tax=Streptomyces sp. NPDC007991 TaxID=3364803 RepID=UPI0036EC4628
MSLLTTAAAALGLLAAGYALGRYRPAHRLSDWAHWQKYDRTMRRHSARWWVVYVLLSVENLTQVAAWLVRNPRKAWHAWRVSKGRNDPPLSPALTFDPDWAAKRRAASNTEEAQQP